MHVVIRPIGFWCVCAAAALTGPAASRGHEIGDCVVGDGFSNCSMYLTSVSTADGVNYLAEVQCPGCINGNPLSTDYSELIVYQQVCPADKYWSDPQDANLQTANQHYSDAEGGEVGATIVGHNERVCWRGGECVEGPCDVYLNQVPNQPSGYPAISFACARTGGKFYYVIKQLGDTCDVEDLYEDY